MDVKSWTVKKAECQTIDSFSFVMLESPLDSREIKPVILKEINSGRTDAEAETPVLWPLV